MGGTRCSISIKSVLWRFASMKITLLQPFTRVDSLLALPTAAYAYHKDVQNVN
jgi:hypothetical protein